MIRRLLIALVVLVLVLAVAGGWAIRWAAKEFDANGPLTEDTLVFIPRGSGLEVITARLSEKTAIRHPWLFKLAVRINGQAAALKAGEYLLPAGVSMSGIVERLVAGRVVHHRLTIPEGLTATQVLALVEAAPLLAGKTPDTVAEGSLLPETYFYARGDARAELIARMKNAMERVLAAAWEKQRPDFPLPSPQDVLILASIVEKETALPEERPRIAAVFLNRLKLGMRLQSDPTVVYGLSGGAPLGRALTTNDLVTPSPYNTYVIDGLPPGPIANPGWDAIRAVLEPAQSDELYFVADGSGGHIFARTLAEHNRNVAKWRRIKKTLGASPLARRAPQQQVAPGGGQQGK